MIPIVAPGNGYIRHVDIRLSGNPQYETIFPSSLAETWRPRACVMGDVYPMSLVLFLGPAFLLHRINPWSYSAVNYHRHGRQGYSWMFLHMHYWYCLPSLFLLFSFLTHLFFSSRITQQIQLPSPWEALLLLDVPTHALSVTPSQGFALFSSLAHLFFTRIPSTDSTVNYNYYGKAGLLLDAPTQAFWVMSAQDIFPVLFLGPDFFFIKIPQHIWLSTSLPCEAGQFLDVPTHVLLVTPTQGFFPVPFLGPAFLLHWNTPMDSIITVMGGEATPGCYYHYGWCLCRVFPILFFGPDFLLHWSTQTDSNINYWHYGRQELLLAAPIHALWVMSTQGFSPVPFLGPSFILQDYSLVCRPASLSSEVVPAGISWSGSVYSSEHYNRHPDIV